ncbi:MAG TPA: hydantoinase B/oxoprolinase family protein, partial [Candidatus Sulfomarinibacteraceae bacterium]|nr:hydantoinase B/oxoprolinase family protein [Candidatus Sulfomarinibacteraceae bacterium]
MVAPATLSVFNHLFASVAEEMGLTLGRAAYSPNIKERLDFSCALFLGDGRMLAQAAHIPVHLGAMPASVHAAIEACSPLCPGDVVILNDPYLGGTHLPDITLVSPVFIEPEGAPDSSENEGGAPQPDFFVASRAHHADVGGMTPGSMPLSTEIYQEGVIIPPLKLSEKGQRNEAVWQLLLRNVRTPVERAGDLDAQLAAHDTGARRLQQIVRRYGLDVAQRQAGELIAYAQRLTEAAIAQMPDGAYSFTDYLDDDGQDDRPVPIQVSIEIQDSQLSADFQGTSPAVRGNLNAVTAIAQAALVYCVRCVALASLELELPMNEGVFAPLTMKIPPGSLLDPAPPHAVAAGNVETSQRIVDVIFGALAQAVPHLIPAASQGTMNNLTFGGVDRGFPFAYYETLGGGIGGGPQGPGGSGMHAHMSNTRNTPVEALEYSFPLRVERYSLRHGSGGRGKHCGGDGLVRQIRFLTPVTVTLTSERRKRAPYGLMGGEPGAPGRNRVLREGQEQRLPGKIAVPLDEAQLLSVETPGGGGWG